VLRAYRLGANSFVVKDPHFEGRFDAAMVLKGFWMRDVASAEESEPKTGQPGGEAGADGRAR
jgi:hypothetical protein